MCTDRQTTYTGRLRVWFGDPDTSIQADQSEQDISTAQVDQRVVNTQGGDYAEGDIDKRQGKFVEGDQFNFDGHFPGATFNLKPTIYQAPRESPPAFQVPYRPMPLIGRDKVLAELADLLTGDAPVAIIGIAGVGKTMLATAFAHRHQKDFPGGVFWLNMEQPDLIAGQVAACAGPGGLNLPDFPALSFDERIARVRTAWNSPLRQLLVLDNLEDPDLLGRWQPTGSGTRVLITTRCDDWPRHVRRLRLPVLPRSDSIELLLGARAADLGVPCETLTGDATERDAADAICDLLGDLPLALAIAAALLRLNPSLRLREFRSQIESDQLFTESANTTTMQAALREAGLPTGRGRGIAATFAISYRQLQPTAVPDARALRMLHAAAYCAPEPIPQELLWRVADLDPVSVEDRMAGDAAMRRLRGLGLIGAPSVEHAGTVTLHRLLAAFVRHQPHLPEVLGATAMALANYTRALQDAGQIKQSLALVPHLESVLTHQAKTLGAEHPDTLRTAHALADTLYEQGDYAGARVRYEAVLAVQTRLLGAEHPNTLATAHNLANTLEHSGRWRAAARLRMQTVRNSEQWPGIAHPDAVQYLLALSRNLNARGYQRAARRLLKTRLGQMPAGIWQSAVQSRLVFYRARAVLTAILARWIASGLVEHTGSGQLLQVCVIVIAVLSYWSRLALIALFALAGAALAAPICSGLPAPWTWVCLALAALIAGGLVPYGAPVIAWLLSVSRVRRLIQLIELRLSQRLQRA
jgi:hypothetical protein